METPSLVLTNLHKSKFKSYYVVWKLIDIDAVGERYERMRLSLSGLDEFNFKNLDASVARMFIARNNGGQEEYISYRLK